MLCCTTLYLSQVNEPMQQQQRNGSRHHHVASSKALKLTVAHKESLTDSRHCLIAAWQSADAHRSLSSWHSATLTSSRRRRRWPRIRALVASNTYQPQHHQSMFSPSHIGPCGGAVLSFRSPQPDTSPTVPACECTITVVYGSVWFSLNCFSVAWFIVHELRHWHNLYIYLQFNTNTYTPYTPSSSFSSHLSLCLAFTPSASLYCNSIIGQASLLAPPFTS